MGLEIVKARPTAGDVAAQQLLDLLSECEEPLRLRDSLVYYGFPRYRDQDDELISASVLLLSPSYGLVLWGTVAEGPRNPEYLTQTAERTDVVFGQIFGKLITNRNLRVRSRDLAVPNIAFVFAPSFGSAKDVPANTTLPVLVSSADVKSALKEQKSSFPVELFHEMVATIDGSRVIPRPKKRGATNADPGSKGGALSTLEAALATFDKKQREGGITDINGPQRIRGLAGSGKTIVLAKKAALTHLDNPTAKIAYTFHTKSLYQQIRRLITRFYRDEHDRDPDWSSLRILHSWGGSDPGIYSLACAANNVRPMTFSDAMAAGSSAPFDVVCQALLRNAEVTPMYDYLFVDEGQDYPASFLQLCAKVSKEMRFVYAYDDLQTIFQPTAPTPSDIFGTQPNGEPRVHLERDVVLYKCYRNPREILVCAHAIGFGLYGTPVQMLQNEEHWNDVGYKLTSGVLKPGKKVVIERPEENSLSLISERFTIDEIIQCKAYQHYRDEVADVVAAIAQDIKDGLRPDDIIVAVLDDRNAKRYLRDISEGLARAKIRCNNIHGAFGLIDFQQESMVTLTTVHKAKGNEAFMVYAVGADGVFYAPNKRNRNALFTAMTRAKAWLRISGVGVAATELKKEVDLAKKHYPRFEFIYPEAKDLEFMKRDLDPAAEMDQEQQRMLDELSDEKLEAYLRSRNKKRPIKQ